MSFIGYWKLVIRHSGRVIASFFLIFSLPVLAANTSSGGIDASSKYVWGENVGWINFGTSEGAVSVNDSALSGYAWGENTGWLSLNCSNTSSCATVDYKVAGDGSGNLSGYAWGENIGWVNFSPTFGGVTIDVNGNFAGYAWGENIGWIVFNCATTGSCATVNYKLTTDYRIRAARPECNNGTDDDGDGATDYPNDNDCGTIDDTAEGNTNGGGVSVTVSGGGFSPAPSAPPQEEVAPVPSPEVPAEEPAGVPPTAPPVTPPSEAEPLFPPVLPEAPPFSILDRLGEIIREVLPFPQARPVPSFPPITRRDLPVQTPRSFTLEWNLVNNDPVNRLVFEAPRSFFAKEFEPLRAEPDTLKVTEKRTLAKEFETLRVFPDILRIQEKGALSGKFSAINSARLLQTLALPLPPEVRSLAAKFPAVGKTFSELGVQRFSDLDKLSGLPLSLPGLSSILGISAGGGVPRSLPVSALSPELKKQMPSEVVFAKTAVQAIDFDIGVRVSEDGLVTQRIETLARKPLFLTVKPDGQTSKVTGYLLFRSRQQVSAGTLDISAASPAGNLLFALVKPVFAHESPVPVREEEQFVLQEFEYTDPDGDGIYTANIETPAVDGEYEIVTVIDYAAPSRESKKIRLITVIDPEGYIYEKLDGREVRLSKASVSLYWRNPSSDAYEVWPASDFTQENPQLTDPSGRYAFLVPEGTYILQVEAPGYAMYRSAPFRVEEGRSVHQNIAMTPKEWWKKLPDWNTLLLIALTLLTLYNMYQNRRRRRPKATGGTRIPPPEAPG